MRRTKIVATLGPATASESGMRQLSEAGVDTIRLNFPHGTRDEKRQTIRDIRRISGELGTEVAVMQDLGGPKIRTGRMTADRIELEEGARTSIVTTPVEGTPQQFSTSYESSRRCVARGAHPPG